MVIGVILFLVFLIFSLACLFCWLKMPLRAVSILIMSLLLRSAHSFLCPITSTSVIRGPHPLPRLALFSTLLTASREELEGWTVPQLKKELKTKGFKVGGRKSELVDRILGVPAGSSPTSTSTPRSTSPPVTIDTAFSLLPPSSVLIYACKS